MSTTINTSIIAVVKNEVTEDEVEEVLDGTDHDSVEEYANHLEGELEAILQHRVFSKADEVLTMEVDTFVDEE